MEPMPSLSHLRTRAGLTQQEFAEKLGITRPHLSKLENSSTHLSPKLSRRLAEVCKTMGLSELALGNDIRAISVKSWAQAGTALDFEELPLDWQRKIATDCPDKTAFAVEIQGDSMEPKFLAGDIAVLMPGYEPRNGSLVVARLEQEGVIFKVFTARQQVGAKVCCFTSYNPVFQPIEVPVTRVIWNFPVYQIIRQVWR